MKHTVYHQDTLKEKIQFKWFSFKHRQILAVVEDVIDTFVPKIQQKEEILQKVQVQLVFRYPKDYSAFYLHKYNAVFLHLESLVAHFLQFNYDDRKIRIYLKALLAHEFGHAYDYNHRPILFEARKQMQIKSRTSDEFTYHRLLNTFESNAYRFGIRLLDFNDKPERLTLHKMDLMNNSYRDLSSLKPSL